MNVFGCMKNKNLSHCTMSPLPYSFLQKKFGHQSDSTIVQIVQIVCTYSTNLAHGLVWYQASHRVPQTLPGVISEHSHNQKKRIKGKLLVDKIHFLSIKYSITSKTFREPIKINIIISEFTENSVLKAYHILPYVTAYVQWCIFSMSYPNNITMEENYLISVADQMEFWHFKSKIILWWNSTINYFISFCFIKSNISIFFTLKRILLDFLEKHLFLIVQLSILRCIYRQICMLNMGSVYSSACFPW